MARRPNWPELAVALSIALVSPAGAEAVDLELVLAVDGSYSVSQQEFGLQVGGTAAALRDPEVLAAIARSAPRGIAVTLVQWSGRGQQRQALPWVRIDSPESAADLAGRIENMSRLVPEGPTALGDAIDFATGLFAASGFEGVRRVIDVSGDGRRNTGVAPSDSRRRALAAGITINGLAILNEEPELDTYFATMVIGGDGAFMLTARDFDDFARAMRLKLLREISDSPLANWSPEAPEAAREPDATWTHRRRGEDVARLGADPGLSRGAPQ